MVIGIAANTTKPGAADVAVRLAKELTERGHECLYEEDLAANIGGAQGLPLCLICGRAELILALGGDGTVLRAVNVAAGMQKPVLGINLGRVGFLSEASPDEIEDVLSAIDKNELTLGTRNMLQAQLLNHGEDVPRLIFNSLNEVSVIRQRGGCVVRLDILIDGEPAGSVVGDGVLVATATGSSAYSLSCGGPLVHPDIDAMIITPISGHVRSMRPMVVPGSSVIRVRPQAGCGFMELSADGKFGIPFEEGKELVIGRAPFRAVLAHIKPYRFYEIVRSKIYGEDVPAKESKGRVAFDESC